MDHADNLNPVAPTLTRKHKFRFLSEDLHFAPAAYWIVFEFHGRSSCRVTRNSPRTHVCRDSKLAMLTPFLLEYKEGLSVLLSTSKLGSLELEADALLLRSSGSDNVFLGGNDERRPVLCENQWWTLSRDYVFLVQKRGEHRDTSEIATPVVLP